MLCRRWAKEEARVEADRQRVVTKAVSTLVRCEKTVKHSRLYGSRAINDSRYTTCEGAETVRGSDLVAVATEIHGEYLCVSRAGDLRAGTGAAASTKQAG